MIELLQLHEAWWAVAAKFFTQTVYTESLIAVKLRALADDMMTLIAAEKLRPLA